MKGKIKKKRKNSINFVNPLGYLLAARFLYRLYSAYVMSFSRSVLIQFKVLLTTTELKLLFLLKPFTNFGFPSRRNRQTLFYLCFGMKWMNEWMNRYGRERFQLGAILNAVSNQNNTYKYKFLGRFFQHLIFRNGKKALPEKRKIKR